MRPAILRSNMTGRGASRTASLRAGLAAPQTSTLGGNLIAGAREKNHADLSWKLPLRDRTV